MRQPSPQDKFKLVKEGKMAEKEFVRQMRQQFPNLITQFNGFKDTVQILKNKSIVFEQKAQQPSGPTKIAKLTPKYEERPIANVSLDAIERGIRYELQLAGFGHTLEGVTEKDAVEAKKKAEKNLAKNPNHYLELIAVDGPKTGEKDLPKTVKRGAADIDQKNGMFKVKLSESKDSIKAFLKEVKANYPQVSDKDIKAYIQHQKPSFDDLDQTLLEFSEYVAFNAELIGEGSKPDFLDIDGDGDKKEPMKKAAKDKEELNEISPELAHVVAALATGAGITGGGYAMGKLLDALQAGKFGEKGKQIAQDIINLGKDDVEEASTVDIKEAIKSTIISILSENVINEAATVNLAKYADMYPQFKSQIIDLQNVVTDIEKLLDSANGKVKAAFKKMESEQDPNTGLLVAGFIAPVIERGFRADLKPILEKFVTDIQTPKVRQITQQELDQLKLQGEEPLEEEPKQTVFSPRKK